MPPKRKKNAKELQKALCDKDAKMKELEAKLASVQAANENKRGTSPTEQAQIAEKIKKARTNKSRKSTGSDDDDDPLKETKKMIAKAIDDPVFAVMKFSKGDSSRDRLAASVMYFCMANQTMECPKSSVTIGTDSSHDAVVQSSTGIEAVYKRPSSKKCVSFISLRHPTKWFWLPSGRSV